jgi:hypothetical protein
VLSVFFDLTQFAFKAVSFLSLCAMELFRLFWSDIASVRLLRWFFLERYSFG